MPAHLPDLRRPAVQLAILALLGATAALPAGAQTAPAPAAADARSYDIPPGPLSPALSRFAGQAGVTLSADPALTDGLATTGLRGRHGVLDGFARLLEGTGLAVGQVGAQAFVLRRAPAATAPAAAAAASSPLAEVTVTANQLGEITEGTGSYTPGAIATATRLVLTPRETPQSISVVTRQEIEDFGLAGINDVIAHVPGVSIFRYDSERTEYYARGFAIQRFHYDGIPMPYDSGYAAGNTLSDMAIYDRVEVLKGATGLLTGTGDPGAAINLIRKKPTRAFQGQATLGAGSWRNYRSELDLSGPLNASGSLRGRAVAAYQDAHSHLDRYQKKTSVLYGTLEADLARNTLLTLGADYQNNDPRGSSWGGIPLYDSTGAFNTMPRSFNNAANWSRWKQYTRTAFATLEHFFDNEWVGKLQLNHQINGYDAQLAAAAGGNPNPANGSGMRLWGPTWYDGRTTSNALDVYASGPVELFGRRHELVFGASASRRTWDTDNYFRPSTYNPSIPNYYAWNGDLPRITWGAPNSSTEKTREDGLYGAIRLNLRDDLKVIAGGRVLDYQKQDLKKSGVAVPYLGAVYDLNESLSAYASYATIYKPQSAQTVEGRTLDPLEGSNYEAGLKGSLLGGRLNASAAYFQLDQNNYAEYINERAPNGTTAARAVQGVKTRGYELEASGQLAPRWQVHAGFSHKISRQQGKKVATQTPENTFTLYASYKPAFAPGLTLGGGARWQDKTWGEVTNLSNPGGPNVQATSKAYWLLDVSARYEFDKHLSAALTVNNLLDKKYYTIFSWYSTYTWGEPRSVTLTMKYKF